MWTAVVATAFLSASILALFIVHYRKGRAGVTHVDYDLAMVTLKQQLRRNPKDATTHVKIGLLLARQRKFEGAIGALNVALAIDPRRTEAHYHRGLALLETGRNEEAEKDFEWIRSNSEDVYYKTAVRTMKRKGA